MKKGLKVLSISLLLSTLVVTGCSCNKDEEDVKNVSRMESSADKILNNLKNGASDYSLLDVYNALITSDAGNKVVANKLVEIVAEEVLDLSNNESVWKPRYEALIKEKLETLAKSDKYLVRNEFNEKHMIDSLLADGYKVTCPSGVTYGTVDNLACDYTDYINKVVRVDVLSTLLKQKYIQDVSLVEKKNVLTNKKIRDVEYFTVSSSIESEYDDLNVRDFVRSIRDRIAAGEAVNFENVEKELQDKLKEIVEVEYKKIGTDKDYNKTLEKEYTNTSTQSAEVGYNKKLETIDNSEYAFTKIISNDSDASAVISQSITSTLLSISDPASSDFSRKVFKVGDYYYLVNANAGATINASDVLLSETSDSSTYVYSIVRFSVINSETTDQTDVYNAIKLLANESTLASGALSHYIKEKKELITVYDDEVKTYLQTLYPDVFAE